MSVLMVRDAVNTVSTPQRTQTVIPYAQADASETTITPFKTYLSKAQKSAATVSTGSTGAQTGTTKLANIFRRASETYNISYDFLTAVAKTESDFNYDKVSPAGARGIMQLMPDEISKLGVTDPMDPEQNIMAAAKLLSGYLEKYDGNYTLAAAAYNAGEDAVDKYKGVPPYSDTKDYVSKVIAYTKEHVKVPDKLATATIDYSVYESSNYNTGPATGGGSTTAKPGRAQDTDTNTDPVKTTPSTDSSAASDDTDSTDSVTDNDSSSSSYVSSNVTVTEDSAFDEGVPATDEDMEQIRVTVGTGSERVTMTYGAYLKYKELGTLGVG